MAENKTKQTEKNLTDFLNTVEDEEKRIDCFELVKMMEQVTGLQPKMWGPAIIGFGSYHYKYESGHEGDMCILGFSPRKQNISLYILDGSDATNNLLKKLGTYKTGKGCLYIKKLSDVDTKVLKQIMQSSYKHKIAKVK